MDVWTTTHNRLQIRFKRLWLRGSCKRFFMNNKYTRCKPSDAIWLICETAKSCSIKNLAPRGKITKYFRYRDKDQVKHCSGSLWQFFSMYHKNVLACLGCSLEASVLLFCLFQAFPKRKQQAILSNSISLCKL